jgi:hypothetical protein
VTRTVQNDLAPLRCFPGRKEQRVSERGLVVVAARLVHVQRASDEDRSASWRSVARRGRTGIRPSRRGGRSSSRRSDAGLVRSSDSQRGAPVRGPLSAVHRQEVYSSLSSIPHASAAAKMAGRMPDRSSWSMPLPSPVVFAFRWASTPFGPATPIPSAKYSGCPDAA